MLNYMKSFIFYLLSFLFLGSVMAQDTIIGPKSEWKYYDGDLSLRKKWKTHQISEGKWKKGNAPFGYGYSDINTIIDFGKDNDQKPIISYYIKEVFIQNSSEALVYELKLRRDDGAIVYVNGYEIWRSNMPDTKDDDPDLVALSIVDGSNESVYHTKLIPEDVFVKGKNKLSVAIYQRNRTTTDCMFDLQLVGHTDAKYFSYLIKSQEGENKQLNEQLVNLSFQQELLKKDTDYKLLEQSNGMNKLLKNILLLLLLVGSLVFLWYYKRLKEKLKKRKTIYQRLKKEKAITDREILNNSLFNLRHNQYLNEIKMTLNGMLQKDAVSQMEIKKLIKNIDGNLNQEEEWQKLESQFNIVHTSFFDKLKKHCPSLSPTELRHCLFIKLLIPTKDIAKLMNIGPRSVQTSRYRIKKKMNLEENLEDFISRI